jgi:hypothetical protein
MSAVSLALFVDNVRQLIFRNGLYLTEQCKKNNFARKKK